jgi:hypothetical protein
MEILVLVALFGVGAFAVFKNKAKSPVLSPAAPNTYGVAADYSPNEQGSVGTLSEPKTMEPLGTSAFRTPPRRVAITPPTIKPRPIQTTAVVSRPASPVITRPGARGTIQVAPVSRPLPKFFQVATGQKTITGRSATVTPAPVRTAPAKVPAKGTASPATFRAVTPAVHPTIKVGATANLHPVARLGQMSAMHPQQDGATHPLSVSHGYAMHPAVTPQGQRTLARNSPK